MIYSELSKWIAQSESWQSAIDYNISKEYQSDYDFLNRADDFYISLLSKMQDALESLDLNETAEVKKDLLAIAKGLEIYSLAKKRESFFGVSYSRNMLYVASLYYLSDFSATAILLLKQFHSENFSTEIERFIYFFLSKNYQKIDEEQNKYLSHIIRFLKTGDIDEIERLKLLFREILKLDDNVESHVFVLAYVSRAILEKFALNNLWQDLRENSPDMDWKPYVRFNISKSPQIWSFFPSQQSAIRNGLLTFEKAFSLQTPTSSGKTSISELVIYNEVTQHPNAKILYLAPFRALASELKNNLGRNLSSRLGIKIKTIYGGNAITEFDKLSIEQTNVLISTPEKFMAIELGLAGTLDDFHLIICDEGHLIDDRSRGISYELLLSRLKNNDTVDRRFVFLSAIIPNIEVINEWLGGTTDSIAKSDYRPTEIELAFLRHINGQRFDLEVNPQCDFPQRYILNYFLSDVDFKTNEASLVPTTYKAKAVAAALKSLNSGAVAIFAPTKDTNKGVAGLALEVIKQMSTTLPKPIDFGNRDAIEELTEYFKYVFGDTFLLVKSIENGFLYHHGDLPQFIREIIEKYVRAEKIKLIICTNTLSEGVNLPIKTLVISTTKRYQDEDNPSVPLALRDLKNLIGRAGRAGKETKGTIIAVNSADHAILKNVLANHNLENVKGFLYEIVLRINDYILKEGTFLSNEILDQLEESDYIDNSIIQLLAEEINPEELDNEINILVENSLTYFQSNDALKLNLRQLFNLRAQRIKPQIENGNIELIRYSGMTLRSFEQIQASIDHTHSFLSSVDNPLDEEFLNFLFDILFEIESFTNNISGRYSRAVVLEAVKSYMNGAWYEELARVLEGTVTDAVSFVKFVEYHMQINSSSIIKYIDMKRSEDDEITSETILTWTNYLVYGVHTETEMILIDLGVPERILVVALSNWIETNNISYRNGEELEIIIFRRNLEILDYLKQNEIPKISVYLMEDFFNKNYQY